MSTPIEGRVIIEVTRKHVLLYQTNGKGEVTDQDVFAFPVPMTRKDVLEEVAVIYGSVYDYVNEAINGDGEEDHSGD